jgi:hypothetical protein
VIKFEIRKGFWLQGPCWDLVVMKCDGWCIGEVAEVRGEGGGIASEEGSCKLGADGELGDELVIMGLILAVVIGDEGAEVAVAKV